MQVQTFNIALPKDLLNRMDAVAKREYRNRSELIREALRVYLTETNEWNALFDFGKKQAKKIGIRNEADVNRIVASYRKGK